MPIYNIHDTDIFFHPVQNVMLISQPQAEAITEEQVTRILNEIVGDKDKYNIADKTMPFDILVRSKDKLYHYSFDEEGNKTAPDSTRTLLDDSGLFHFQFSESDTLTDRFSLKDGNQINLETISDEQTNDELLDEVAEFINKHHHSHFKDWNLDNPDVTREEIREHTDLLIKSSSEFYLVRNENNDLVAICGFSLTKDNELAYQTITVTDTAWRDQGVMLTVLQHFTNQYTNALMTAYIVNAKIRKALGEACMTHQGENAIANKNDYLIGKIEEKGITCCSNSLQYN